MKRIYDQLIKAHFKENHQMLFLMGPRQVGKTTAGLSYKPKDSLYYFNWDNEDDQKVLIHGPGAVAEHIGLHQMPDVFPTVIFDEIHKRSRWKTFIKGFFDTYGRSCHILVTGSARLDVYQRGGDSLMGRYFHYRLHPFSVREVLDPCIPRQEIRSPKPIDEKEFQALLHIGGFPEPFLRANKKFTAKWHSFRYRQLFREDLRDLTRIQELSQLELLAELLIHQVGQLTSRNALAKKVCVTAETIRRWLEALKSTYYCYEVRPYTKNITRSLLKEPKYYLWDWSLVPDPGARYENFIASHLLKAIHFWNDHGFGSYNLYFIRDKEKREVDFLVTREEKPWFLVEAKSSDHRQLSPQLIRFQKMTGAEHAFQVALDMPFVNRSCFSHNEPLIVPAKTFLSQLL